LKNTRKEDLHISALVLMCKLVRHRKMDDFLTVAAYIIKATQSLNKEADENSEVTGWQKCKMQHLQFYMHQKLVFTCSI